MSIQISYDVALIAYLHARLRALGEQPYELKMYLSLLGYEDSSPDHDLVMDRTLDSGEVRRVEIELREKEVSFHFQDVKGFAAYTARASVQLAPSELPARYAGLWSEIAHHLRI